MAGDRAALVIVSREASAREIVGRELTKRYGADYQVVICDQPLELAARVRALRNASTEVAMVLGGIGGLDQDGIDVLAAVRRIAPTALKVAAVRWGDWETVGPIFDAVTLGKIDHWVARPEGSLDEEFHHSITEYLSEWRGRVGGGFEAVRVVGEQ